jgi:5'-3' exonuclease
LQTVKRIKDVNSVFKFDRGTPFKPLEQLMMVLPKTMSEKEKFLNPKFVKVMKNHPEYYPDKFKLEVLWGQKFIYSEPDLPNINASEVLGKTRRLKLTAAEKRLNQMHDHPLYFGVENK